MDQREFAARVEMRVRILIVHRAMRGPARVADAKGTRYRFLPHEFCEYRNASRAFACLQASSLHDSQAGGIVAAIFQAAQSVE